MYLKKFIKTKKKKYFIQNKNTCIYILSKKYINLVYNEIKKHYITKQNLLTICIINYICKLKPNYISNVKKRKFCLKKIINTYLNIIL